MTWDIVKLGAVANFRNGINYTNANHGQGLKLISVADFQDRITPEYSTLGEINPDGIVSDRDILADGDLLFVRSNGNRALVGRSMYIDRPPEPTTFSAFCIRLRFLSASVYSKFYAYLFRTDLLRRTISNRGSGTNISNLNQQVLSQLPVPLPPLDVQKRIASILSAYDDLIENNRRRIQLLEEAARLLYREWFVHLRFPGHEHVPVHEGVPQGWERVKISDMGEVVTGKTPSTKMADYYGREIPFIKTPDMHKASVVVTTEQYLSRSGADSQKNKYIPPGSIMVSCIGTVGVVAMNASIAQTNQQINSLVPTMPNIQFYAYFALSDLRPFLEGMGGGATMANVSKSKFESIEVVLPGIETLQKFDHYCRPIFLQIEKLTIQSLKLAAARDLLLPRLMNGEIAV